MSYFLNHRLILLSAILSAKWGADFCDVLLRLLFTCAKLIYAGAETGEVHTDVINHWVPGTSQPRTVCTRRPTVVEKTPALFPPR